MAGNVKGNIAMYHGTTLHVPLFDIFDLSLLAVLDVAVDGLRSGRTLGGEEGGRLPLGGRVVRLALVHLVHAVRPVLELEDEQNDDDDGDHGAGDDADDDGRVLGGARGDVRPVRLGRVARVVG